eukprot:1159573-Pelagomonas_calceolata.AAC.2
MDETSDLLNLPDDCLFLILSPQPGGSRNGLQPGDVATVGLTCKRLSDFVKVGMFSACPPKQAHAHA